MVGVNKAIMDGADNKTITVGVSPIIVGAHPITIIIVGVNQQITMMDGVDQTIMDGDFLTTIIANKIIHGEI